MPFSRGSNSTAGSGAGAEARCSTLSCDWSRWHNQADELSRPISKTELYYCSVEWLSCDTDREFTLFHMRCYGMARDSSSLASDLDNPASLCHGPSEVLKSG